MEKYHKIQTVFKRNPNNMKELLENQWTLPEFQYLANNDWICDEKIDGTNIRIIFKEGKVEYRGRTDRAQLPKYLLDRLREKYTVEFFQSAFKTASVESGICLYGEGYGPGIQKGGKYRKDQDFILFDIMIDGWFLKRDDVKSIITKNRIPMVPEIFVAPLYEVITNVKFGFNSMFGNFEAEGIVARPLVPLYSRNGDRIITKIKCKDFDY